MQRIDPTVKKETLYVFYGLAFFTAILQLVLLLLGYFGVGGFRYTYVTVLSSVYTDVIMLADFFIMGVQLQKYVKSTPPEESAKLQKKVQASASVRAVIKIALLGLGVWLCYKVLTNESVIDLFALLLPVFFPRVSISIRSALLRAKEQNK